MRALLDANVLISAAIHPGGTPGRLLAALLERDAFVLLLSPIVVVEVETALALPRVRKYLREPHEALLWVADLVALAVLVEDTGRVKGVCRDPEDDAVLSAAVEGRADVIVTGDADLISLEAFDGIAIVTPRAFLDRLERT